MSAHKGGTNQVRFGGAHGRSESDGTRGDTEHLLILFHLISPIDCTDCCPGLFIFYFFVNKGGSLIGHTGGKDDAFPGVDFDVSSDRFADSR